jgi:hypothetical protein
MFLAYRVASSKNSMASSTYGMGILVDCTFERHSTSENTLTVWSASTHTLVPSYGWDWGRFNEGAVEACSNG